ncbi:hypothetical protein, partial [Bacteroides sp.]|uniref:hypothetical protein n=1 Tax=Bacteroides sp. TaxID=29523 RepID=UPI0025865A54
HDDTMTPTCSYHIGVGVNLFLCTRCNNHVKRLLPNKQTNNISFYFFIEEAHIRNINFSLIIKKHHPYFNLLTSL